MLMTREALRTICKEQGLYRTPALNDRLYANFKGFSQIANLEEYTSLKALFLEGNAFDSLDGLPPLKELKCLYLQQNALTHISNLDAVPELDTLNVSHNSLARLDGLSACPKLATLIATHNRLDTLESVLHLSECKQLHTLDLQNNHLADPAILSRVLTQLPELKCLYLKGNPVVSAIKQYRKAVVAAIPTLTYLDDRPVFENERRATNAWAVGGPEAERDELRKIKEGKEAREMANFEFMLAMRKEGHRKRRALLGLPEGDVDPALEEMSDGEYEILEEPPELVAARERLAAYTARAGVDEPAELSEARRRRANEGQPIEEGQWSDAACDQDDGQIYLESIRQSATELVKGASQAVHKADIFTEPDNDRKTGGGRTEQVAMQGAKAAQGTASMQHAVQICSVAARNEPEAPYTHEAVQDVAVVHGGAADHDTVQTASHDAAANVSSCTYPGIAAEHEAGHCAAPASAMSSTWEAGAVESAVHHGACAGPMPGAAAGTSQADTASAVHNEAPDFDALD